MSNDFLGMARAAEADPGSVDFNELRRAYMQSSEYRPAKHIMHSRLMQITNAAANFEEVAATCRNILDANPMDLEARMLLAYAQEKTGQHAAAEKSHQFVERMIDTILATGDGKSFDTAWQLVAESELWTLARKVFGMKAQGQTRHQFEDGRIVDMVQGKIEDREVEMYFDVTAFVNAIERLIGDEENT